MAIGILSFLLSAFLALGQASPARFAAKVDETPAPVIIIGFVGGFIRYDNAAHGAVQLAARLRKDYPSGVYVRVFENHRGEDAHREILRVLDTNHNGTLSPEEKQRAQIIIYGHSWGASETVVLARKLQADAVPVLLTIQMDSVAKPGEDDSLIPSNVSQAVNFYQSDGLLRGRPKIRAADPSRTEIIGNYRLDYSSNSIPCTGYSWYARTFEKPHIMLECDPKVLQRVESLMRSKLPPLAPSASAE